MRGKLALLPVVLALAVMKRVFRILRWLLVRLGSWLDRVLPQTFLGGLWQRGKAAAAWMRRGTLSKLLLLAAAAAVCIGIWVVIGDGAQGPALDAPVQRVTLSACDGEIIALQENGRIRTSCGENSLHLKLRRARCRDVVSVAAGDYDVFALRRDGTVAHIGRTDYPVEDWENIIALTAAESFVLGLRSDGTVAMAKEKFLLGGGPSQVTQWTDITAISACEDYSLGVRSDGTVTVTGCDPKDKSTLDFLTAISEWRDITAVFAEPLAAVAIKRDGSLCVAPRGPKEYSDLTQWTDIVWVDSGWSYFLGLRSDGTVLATGDNRYGQCDVEEWTNITAIVAEQGYSLGICSDGTVVAAGKLPYDYSADNWKNLDTTPCGENP